MQRVLRQLLAGGQFSGIDASRSEKMRSIRSQNNRSTEGRLRAFLIRAQVRGWTIHPKNVPGTPEFYFSAEKVAVFTDGCFWHGCRRCVKSPRTNAAYWKKKIELNVARDRKDNRALRASGVRVVRFWEHEIRENPTACVNRILALLE
jgi:DNA mismatch endonuclease (patch repair protein)